MRVTQLMEDAWLACELDRWWAHPLNLGWINLFARWATSPGFLFWWPLLSPMYSPGFRRFIAERFPLRSEGDAREIASAFTSEVHRREQPPDDTGLATRWWRDRAAQRMNWSTELDAATTRIFYENMLTLSDRQRRARIQAGLAMVLVRNGDAGWSSDDFFVPPSLWGAGIGSRFLFDLLWKLPGTVRFCFVIVKVPPPGHRHELALNDRQSFVDQYRRYGFRERRPTPGVRDPDADFCARLGYAQAEGDALLVLDLPQWRLRNAKPGGAQPSGAPDDDSAGS
ncbi:MAG: hypothetical protein R2712_14275 [Vicinamibacterales bacterium]